MADTLHSRIGSAVERFSDHTAVIDAASGTRLSYAQLNALADAWADRMAVRGAAPGDRIGICLPKSAQTVAALVAVLKCGAAYVPVDAASPADRNQFIFKDCSVRMILASEMAAAHFTRDDSFRMAECLDHGLHLLIATGQPGETTPGLAYVLYTSGSTGLPKGVMLTHGNALTFVDWCVREFVPTVHDRFSSHAPFHFDLSILDLFVPLVSGAAVVVFNEGLGKNPAALVAAVATYEITCWYSTPSILRLMLDHGGLAARPLPSLRLVLFAGEVFPIGALTALRQALPHPVYYNLYGPTETNVCTCHRLPDVVEADRSDPYPIGRCCYNDEARVIRSDGLEAAAGEEGELLIRGGTVMQGYWNLPDRTAAAFLTDEQGRSWYRTGDLVSRANDDPECFVYVGRLDRMVKRRGYRVELGEIEAAYQRLPDLRESAAVAVPDPDGGIKVWLFFSCREAAGPPPSSLKLKQHGAAHLPAYMIPDVFRRLKSLPMTSTSKIDYQALSALSRMP